MKRMVLAIAASVIAAACSSSTPAGPNPVAGGSTNATDAKPGGVVKNWVAHLSGDDEVPANASKGQGEAIFTLSPDGQVLRYRLISSNIHNIVQAHIHIAPAGVNGQISTFLYGLVAANGGRHDGVLMTGEIRTANIINGDHPTNPTGVFTLEQLVAKMDQGLAYVNVHTNDGVAPGNTGPGDLAGGEIRGQIEAAGHGN